MPRWVRPLYALVASLCWGCARPPVAEPVAAPSAPATAPDSGAVRLHTTDGATIHGRRVQPVGESQPLRVLLIHMLGRTLGDWHTFAATLAERGYESLAIDLRGHGESTAPAGATVTYREFTPAQWQAAANDLVAARAELGARPVVLCGASIGANLALVEAAAHPAGVAGVAALSPGLDFRGVSTEPAVAALKLPLFLAACDGDTYSFDSLEKLAAGHSGVTLYRGQGSYHGTELLGAADGLDAQLLEWLDGLAR